MKRIPQPLRVTVLQTVVRQIWLGDVGLWPPSMAPVIGLYAVDGSTAWPLRLHAPALKLV